VTHDQIEAMTMATHVAVMKDGRVEQFDAPATLLAKPASAFVATFVGTPAANVIAVQARGGRLLLAGRPLAAAGSDNEQISLLYAPTTLGLKWIGEPVADRVVAGTLIEVAPMAGRYVCTVNISAQRVSVVTSEPPGVHVGEAIGVAFPLRPQGVFDSAGRQIADHASLRGVL
jgi:iron(III) transport system ATP-binding protein